MRNIYKIDNYQYVHNNHHFSLNENQKEIQIVPAGQMLADSDHLALIYVVEEGGEFSYLQFSRELWSHLVDIMKSNQNPYVTINGKAIELIHFIEELEMLIFNIEGNDNYGKEFVDAIEEAFKEIFQKDTL
ncbi:hypothetical protein SAMN05880501_101369 [Ureibacillus xyleni]|uniref:Uncharacterized protein n=1 Tax=Ureibacillus xyleni TaxID=614648 RepID=A0A285RC86_9BACL|nr:hypothetical protein [Ureibacillus xyleni]SOB91723.1 hypothetical protein SAMN05880501_101369 [Ureibacillus xyleni]